MIYYYMISECISMSLSQWNGLELLDVTSIGGNYYFKIRTDVEHWKCFIVLFGTANCPITPVTELINFCKQFFSVSLMQYEIPMDLTTEIALLIIKQTI